MGSAQRSIECPSERHERLLRDLSGRSDLAQSEPIGFLDLFKIGIGPSSSHTMGPMKAAAAFVGAIPAVRLRDVTRISVTLYGSLAWTGKGHATDRAIILGLTGLMPDQVDPDSVDGLMADVNASQRLGLPHGVVIGFRPDDDIRFDMEKSFARHPNALQFDAFGGDGELISSEVWYSIGGGFVEREGAQHTSSASAAKGIALRSADELIDICRSHDCSIADIALANECAHRSIEATTQAIDAVIDAMMHCIDRGLKGCGQLPGSLRVQRRAMALNRRIELARLDNAPRPSDPFDQISAYAIAVNEENAAGGRVVTAPTNGAAGVVPAVLRYYRDGCNADREGMHRFLLTATVIGGLIKQNASISGAEVGCQGEVGSAAAMAAAGLAAALGASVAQIENAAEIAMEHHLGMTCDPIAGLVQIPCIERNAFGAIKAVSAAYLAMAGDGSHRVSLDQVIETMRQTGLDMHDKYRETSRGGLAVSVPEC